VADKKRTKNENFKDIFKENKKIIIGVLSGFLIAVIFLEIGITIGNGTLQFGDGSLFHINSSNVNGLPNTLNYGAIQQEYNILKSNFDGKLSASQLQNGIQAGLTDGTGDPFTEYFSAAQAKDFNNELNNTFSGIGAELGADSKGNINVISPLNGYPADKAGIKAQDIILSVNGKSTAGQNVDAVVNEIRGPNGTPVTLVVDRAGQQLTFKIIRQQIEAPSVQYSVINGNIGYIQIIDFSGDTAQLAQQAANSFKSQNVKYIILDLRDNPGGLVDQAVSVSSLWLPEGKTVLVEKHNNVVTQTYTSNGNDILQGIPTAVLINGGSASASEITAAALHDNKAAVLIGQKSYGKGTAQQIFPLANGAEMKVTIVHWFTPAGASIEYKGIKPDIVVAPGANDSPGGSDAQKDAAIQYLQTH
jgi:carboxyl-terminal processing protease